MTSSARRKLAVVVGTRPEVIKQAPLLFAANTAGSWDCRILFTGQHRDMGMQMLHNLGLRADSDLNLMQPGQTPADFLGAAVPAIANYLQKEKPDWVAVQGDTTTALAGALAGFYARIPIVHIEAGLRTYDRNLPFPEELHRQLVTRLAIAHAAPTSHAASVLHREGVPKDRILVSGNTGIDCLFHVLGTLRRAAALPQLPPDLVDAVVAHANWAQPLVLITIHRRESIGSVMAGMCRAIRRLAQEHRTALFVLPVHLNPSVREVVLSELGAIENVRLIGPQSYTEFAWLLDRCAFVLTDSGGIQEEGPALGKPVLVLRDVTERPEAVDCGSAQLVGCSEEKIYAAAHRLLHSEEAFRAMAVPRFPYGNGTSAKEILGWLATVPAHSSDLVNPG